MCKKHPDVAKKGKTVFLEDLWADPIVRFHRRFYIPMSIFFCFVLPTMIPVWCWGETMWNSFFIAGMARYCFSLNLTWLVNSAAHKYGDQPYDKYIEARENAFVAFFGHGEGWHNYHHVFPWDYSTSELGYTLNLTKVFIDFMALIGQAYDLKSAQPEMVKSRKLKTGDGTRLKQVEEHEQQLFCTQS
ncbi:Stearoyl-CoA desaturase 5 [Araneus ventricosus]|uniref:Stearoyl-CoA desaturase 5 n=1 Tax=Araneus ventricosus TaxID=182803 RepID=A0A4Y2UB88_ARAVE|nr:Stearoyl-CoA desaturase 5 [Araneus ventricosus]GBO11154.1 Stearoyl-CoA desaturase 5 [Araneus ventricosus]